MSQGDPVKMALVFKGGPWWTFGTVTQRALVEDGRPVEVTSYPSELMQLDLVAKGEADLGINTEEIIWWAYTGKAYFAGQAKSNLRAIAAVGCPIWLGIAVEYDARLLSLEQIKERHFPLRLCTNRGISRLAFVVQELLSRYGFSLEDIETWGGVIHGRETTAAAIKEGNFDAIINNCYLGGPVGQLWQEACLQRNLRFLPVREDVLEDLCASYDLKKGLLPSGLLRGVREDTPTLMSRMLVLYCTEAAPEDFAYSVAQTLDQHSGHFIDRHITLSYNPWRACRETWIPLHSGAEAYYKSRGYL